MSEDIDEVEIEEEWDETLIDVRRFAVEQAVLMRSPGESLDQIFERASRIVEYIAYGRG
ncbi:MAG TPA: hypothetical protein VEA80_10215 [Vitreimonas sp.]|uniref:hypothetical protein n=1 Tax=Vitreimonas sp. TaxID=3069702 RepID=UPI002D4AE629|nr:hypothetical protein [Vitreimonas sp.]HYD87839.1 hypothetical protein [Vitreimonas sp.]